MKTRPMLTAADVEAMIVAAEAEAKNRDWAATIAVLDDGGHLMHFHRMDGTSPMNAEVAILKARTAALTRKSTKAYEDRIAAGRNSILSMPFTAVQGGLPIMVDGFCVGAIGVSGLESHQDEQVAEAGIKALNLSGTSGKS